MSTQFMKGQFSNVFVIKILSSNDYEVQLIAQQVRRLGFMVQPKAAWVTLPPTLPTD